MSRVDRIHGCCESHSIRKYKIQSARLVHSSGDPVSLSLVLCDATQTWPIWGRSNRRWCMSRWPWLILSFRICRQHAYGRLYLKWHEVAKRTACWRDTDQHASTRAIWALPMRFCGRQEDHPRISRRPWLILSFRICHHHAYSRLYLKWHFEGPSARQLSPPLGRAAASC